MFIVGLVEEDILPITTLSGPVLEHALTAYAVFRT
jgi:hypothetical protein